MIKKTHTYIHRLSRRIGKKAGLDLPYFVKNGYWVILRQGVVIVSGLALSIAFSRLVSQEIFGQYQLILSVLAIVSIVSLPGLNASVLQSAARGSDGDYRESIRLSFYFSLLGIPILLIIGAYYYYYYHAVVLGIAFMITAIFFPFFYAPNTWDSFLQGKSKFQIAFRYASTQAILNALFTIGIILLSRGKLLFIILGYLISYTFFNVLFYFKSLRYIENDEKGDAIHYGWFLTKINVLSLVADNLDKVIVGIFLGPQALAVYFLGITVVKMIFDLSKTVTSVLLPKISKQNTAILRHYAVVFFMLMPLSVLAYFLMPIVVPILFSETYRNSITIAQIPILFLPFVFINLFYLSHFLYYVKNKKIITWYTIILAGSKILLVVPLTLTFGPHGLAFIFGFQTVMSLFILWLLRSIFRENTNVPLEKKTTGA